MFLHFTFPVILLPHSLIFTFDVMKCFMMLRPGSSPISSPPLCKYLDYKYYMSPVPDLLQETRLSPIRRNCTQRWNKEMGIYGCSGYRGEFTHMLSTHSLSAHLDAFLVSAFAISLSAPPDPAVLGVGTSRGSPQTVTDQIWRTHTLALVPRVDNSTACSVLSLRVPPENWASVSLAATRPWTHSGTGCFPFSFSEPSLELTGTTSKSRTRQNKNSSHSDSYLCLGWIYLKQEMNIVNNNNKTSWHSLPTW